MHIYSLSVAVVLMIRSQGNSSTTAFGRIATVKLRPSLGDLHLRLLSHFQSIIDLDA
jgi:hypothetical protein